MDEKNNYLWKGTISSKYKKKWILYATVLFSIFLPIELGLLVWFLDMGFNLEPQFLIYLLLGTVGAMIIIPFLAILTYIFNFFPRYFVSSKRLVIEKWTHLGKKRKNYFDLKNVKTIYIENTDENSFNFFKLTVDEILMKCPLEDFPEYFITQWDFQFGWVNSPDELLRVLKTILKLKDHPTLPNIYEKV